MSERKTSSQPDSTVPARSSLERSSQSLRTDGLDVPWMVSQFLHGDGDLHTELAQRYPNQPLMSLFSSRVSNTASQHGFATLSTQDGWANIIVEVDGSTYNTTFAFSMASMLTLRFDLVSLSDLDRTQWLEQVVRGQQKVNILWGKMRWRSDYMIWSQRPHYTNIYAFSQQHHIEAAARLTPDVTGALIEWLGQHWQLQQSPDDDELSVNW
ncbi:MAG: hypothetical protein KC547_19750 [Anaerolineae bacterium]|nr:hypothetical protein [Anaerolineae bacterium]